MRIRREGNCSFIDIGGIGSGECSIADNLYFLVIITPVLVQIIIHQSSVECDRFDATGFVAAEWCFLLSFVN